MDTLERIITRFTRALDSYDAQALAQQQICRRLIALLHAYTDGHFHRALEIGCGTGGFTRLLEDSCNINEWCLNDLCEGCREKVMGLFSEQQPVFIAGNAETTEFPGLFNLIASASAFQWIQHPQGFLHRLSVKLSPGGMLLFNTFTPDNLREIRLLTGRGLNYPTIEQLTKWLRRDYHILHLEKEEISLSFNSPMDVLRHLKSTGVTATGGEHWTRRQQTDFCQRYADGFSTPDNKVTLTYCPLYIVAARKNE